MVEVSQEKNTSVWLLFAGGGAPILESPSLWHAFVTDPAKT
jgi:hypothetical protein